MWKMSIKWVKSLDMVKKIFYRGVSQYYGLDKQLEI